MVSNEERDAHCKCCRDWEERQAFNATVISQLRNDVAKAKELVKQMQDQIEVFKKTLSRSLDKSYVE